MSETTFDLFGDPIPANHGGRGRPQHLPTQENRNRVNMLLAFGLSNERIAAALRVTQPTLRRHYFSELKYREVARDRLNLEVTMKFWKMFQDGNVAAGREFLAMQERNDLMTYGQVSSEPRPPKLGKKEQALLAAQQPDTETTIGELMAQRLPDKPDALN